MRWKNMSDKCQVLKWQRVTGHGVNSNEIVNNIRVAGNNSCNSGCFAI